MNECSFEFCLIEVKLKHENVLLCSGYRAPNTNPNEFLADYEKLLKTVNAGCNKLIIGIDHNLDLLNTDPTPQPISLWNYLSLSSKYQALLGQLESRKQVPL